MKKAVVLSLLVWAVSSRAATYTTYVGDAYPYQTSSIATDTNGNTYIAGSRVIGPVTPGFYSVPQTVDILVSKIDAAGNVTSLATFSGKGSDRALGIAVDPAGNIYLAGETTSGDFPLRHPLQSVPYTVAPGNYGTTGFLMKLSPDGAVIYSTYLGGTLGYSSLNAVAVDAAGNAYVTGDTAAQDYQHSAGLPAGQVSTTPVEQITAAFFAKVSADGSRVLYAGAISANPICEAGFATCQGGTDYTAGNAIAVDAAGDAYIAGNTNGSLAGTAGALESSGSGAFVAKVNAAGSGLDYLTPLANGQAPFKSSAAYADVASAIAVDSSGNVYIAGLTKDPGFPVTAGAFQKIQSGSGDAFIAKLNSTGSAMVWATYLGGSGNDKAQTIALDDSGNVWVSGITASADFPTTASAAPGGGEFLAELDASGSALLYSAAFPADTVGQALALDPSGTLHVAGGNGLASAFPATAPPGIGSAPWMFGVGNAAGGALSGRLAPAELISIYGLHLGPSAPSWGTFDASGYLPVTLAGSQVKINGIAAPLLYVSATQINAVAPVESTPGSSVELQITQAGSAIAALRLMVDAAVPQVFRTANGGAAAINQDGSFNSQANPAPAGTYVSIWATGTGYAPSADGQLIAGPDQFCDLQSIYCSVFQSDGTPVTVSYSGSAPDLVTGAIQINFQVGPSPNYYIAVDGAASDGFFLYTSPAN